MITQTINLNLIPGSPLPRINVSQYDNGSRTLQFNLYNGVSPYEIPSGASVSIVGTKADNTGFEYACTFDGSLVSVDITDQMTVFAGEVQSELQIRQSGEVLGTANFIINVERAALSDDTQISETDIPIIQRIPEILEEAEEYADTAHKWATFGADTETPSSTNNAKYWAEQSQVYAAGALHWKSSVTFANIPTSGLTVGDFYNITDDFTTDSRFDEGAGIKCAAGTNIVWDTNNKWDILTPSTVASQVKYDGTTSGLSATNVQGAIDEIVDISENTSSALVEQSIGTFPEFAISTNSADSYYSGGRGGVRNSSEKLLILSVSHLRSDGARVSVGFQLYATSQEALEQSSYTQYGDLATTSYKTQSGNTVYVGTQTGRWVIAIPSKDELLKTSYSASVTIDGKTKRIQNVVDMKYRNDGRNFWIGFNPMVDQIVDKVLFGDIDYPSGIYSTKSNNEIISLFENSVAYNEPTTTASQSYTKGEYLTQGGYFKKVTSAIASGDTISSSNTSATTVGAELTQLNSDLNNLYTLDWANMVSISNVYTPTKNGIVIAEVGGTAGTFISITDDSSTTALAIGWLPNNGNIAVNAVVTKSRQISIATSGSLGLKRTFIPFK